MSLQLNATMTFTDYQIQDSGIKLHFVCLEPGGGGEPTDYYTFVSDSEINSITNVSTGVALVTSKLQRQYRATSLTTKLDTLIGRSVVI